MWIAKLKDGKTVNEHSINWNNIKDQAVSLMLVSKNGMEISLPDNLEKYVQAKTASANLGSGTVNVESRYIGFVIDNHIIKIRLNETTGNINVEVENVI